MERISIDYRNGSRLGQVHNCTTSGMFNAFSGIESKTFKTLKGAQHWIECKGFVEVAREAC